MRGFWSRKPASDPVPERPEAPAQRKPRILIAGEFSAGKTRLINGLLGKDILPSNVTATALPPVWLVRGEPALIRIGFSGRGEPIRDLTAIDLEKTQYCALSNPATVLGGMDLIDTPGNSDPNMAPETWQRMLTFADAVVWCTNATQAWRQSEKAVWQAMPARLRQNATLIVTHADLLATPVMAERVLNRLQREAASYFETFLMASLMQRADLDRIAAHLRQVSDALRPEGAPNRLISDFAASVPVRNPVVEEAPVVAPPIAEPAVAAKPAPAAAAPIAEAITLSSGAETAAPGAEPQARRGTGATVLPMVRPRPAEADALASASDETTGPARALWAELSKSVDRSDPASVLAAVDHFITRLDARAARTGTLNSVSPGGSGPAAEIYE